MDTGMGHQLQKIRQEGLLGEMTNIFLLWWHLAWIIEIEWLVEVGYSLPLQSSLLHPLSKWQEWGGNMDIAPPSGTHLFSRKNFRIRWIFPLFIFPNRSPHYVARLISIFKMCSWGWGLFGESITNHPQTPGIFGRSEAVSLKLIFHGER